MNTGQCYQGLLGQQGKTSTISKLLHFSFFKMCFLFFCSHDTGLPGQKPKANGPFCVPCFPMLVRCCPVGMCYQLTTAKTRVHRGKVHHVDKRQDEV